MIAPTKCAACGVEIIKGNFCRLCRENGNKPTAQKQATPQPSDPADAELKDGWRCRCGDWNAFNETCAMCGMRGRIYRKEPSPAQRPEGDATPAEIAAFNRHSAIANALYEGGVGEGRIDALVRAIVAALSTPPTTSTEGGAHVVKYNRNPIIAGYCPVDLVIDDKRIRISTDASGDEIADRLCALWNTPTSAVPQGGGAALVSMWERHAREYIADAEDASNGLSDALRNDHRVREAMCKHHASQLRAALASAPQRQAGVVEAFDPNELLRAAMPLIRVGARATGPHAGDTALVERIDQHLAETVGMRFAALAPATGEGE